MVHRKIQGYSIEKVFKVLKKEFLSLNLSVKDVFGLRLFPFSSNKIFHYTGANGIYLLFNFYNTNVLTIHDIGHYTMTLNGLKRWIYGLLWLKIPMLLSKKVVCISSYTEDEIKNNINPFWWRNKISVVPNPVTVPIVESKKQRLCTKIGVIGTAKNKNLNFLLQVLANSNELVALNIVGELDQKLLTEYKALKIVQYLNLTDDKLLDVIDDSSVIYFCSSYEGFGLPFLEGLARDKPVLLSDIDIFRELIRGTSYPLISLNHEKELSLAIQEGIDFFGGEETFQNIRSKILTRFDPLSVAKMYKQIYLCVD